MINYLDKSADFDNYNMFHTIFIPKKLADEQCEHCYRIFCCGQHKDVHIMNKHKEQLAIKNMKMEKQKKILSQHHKSNKMGPKISTPLSMKNNLDSIKKFSLKEEEMDELKKGLADKSFKILIKHDNKKEQECLTIENSNSEVYDKENKTEDSLKLSIKYTKINGSKSKEENKIIETKNLTANYLPLPIENCFEKQIEIKLSTSKDLLNDTAFNPDKTLQQTLYSCMEFSEMDVTYNKMEQDTFYSVIDDSIEIHPKEKLEKNNTLFQAIKKVICNLLIYFPNKLSGLNEKNNIVLMDNKGEKRRYMGKNKDTVENYPQDEVTSPDYKKFCPSKDETNFN